jgi:hypothetical protein
VSSTSHVANFRALKTEKPKKKKKKKRFAHVAADGRVRVFESDNGEMLAEMHHKNNLKHKPTSVAFAPAPAAQQDVRQQKKKKKKKKKNPFVKINKLNMQFKCTEKTKTQRC